MSDTEVQPQTERHLQPWLEDEDIDAAVAEPRPPRRRRIWIIGLIIVLVLAAVGGGLAYAQSNRASPVRYTQAAASIGDLAVTISATGPIAANAEYDLSFGTSGMVNAIDVHVGQQVKAGQTLATLNSTSLNDLVAQAQQSVNSAQQAYDDAISSQNSTDASASASITAAQDTYDNSPQAQANLDQLNQAKDQAYAQEQSAQSQVNSAYQQLLAARLQLKAAQDNLAEATLTAPANATVAAINGEIGENVGAGSGSSSASSSSSGGSSSSAFIVLIDTSKLIIPAQVNEADIANVQVGQPAQFTVAAYPNQTFRAYVTAVEPVGQTSSNVVSYTVDLAVDQQSVGSAHLYPGMTATLTITTAERLGALMVPASALSFITTALQTGELSRTTLRSLATSASASSSAAQGSRGIVVELRNGKLTPVLVTTGLSNGQYTEILSGLQSGEQVVTGQTGGNTPTTSTTSGAGGGLFGGRGAGGGVRFSAGG
jgi:multidrug efflux pump subunit AcrA (membrane-fusion protein)